MTCLEQQHDNESWTDLPLTLYTNSTNAELVENLVFIEDEDCLEDSDVEIV